MRAKCAISLTENRTKDDNFDEEFGHFVVFELRQNIVNEGGRVKSGAALTYSTAMTYMAGAELWGIFRHLPVERRLSQQGSISLAANPKVPEDLNDED